MLFRIVLPPSPFQLWLLFSSHGFNSVLFFVFYASCFSSVATVLLPFFSVFFRRRCCCRYSFKIYGIFVLCSSMFQVSKFLFFLLLSLHFFETCLICFFSLPFFCFGFGDIFVCTFLLAVQSLMYVQCTCVLGYDIHMQTHGEMETHTSNHK